MAVHDRRVVGMNDLVCGCGDFYNLFCWYLPDINVINRIARWVWCLLVHVVHVPL